ncbi:hypothetical protein D3C78_1510090 [compost metagenome]
MIGVVLFDQRQAASLFIGQQPLPIAQNQAHRLAGTCQSASPEGAEATGAENMPGAAHLRFATRYNKPAF